jgi:hypothetical protein
VSPGLDEYFLQDVFGFAPLLDDAKNQSEQQTAVAIVKFAERRLIAHGHAIEQRDVSPNVFLISHRAMKARDCNVRLTKSFVSRPTL